MLPGSTQKIYVNEPKRELPVLPSHGVASGSLGIPYSQIDMPSSASDIRWQVEVDIKYREQKIKSRRVDEGD